MLATIGSAALLGAWCGLLFNSGVVDTLHWRHRWVVLGLIWAAAMIGQTSRSRENDRRAFNEPSDRYEPPPPVLPVTRA